VGHVLVALLVLAAALLVALATLSCSPSALLGMVMLALGVAWLLDLTCVNVVVRAVGLSLAPAAGLLILLVVNAAILVPVMPASLGAFELGKLPAVLRWFTGNIGYHFVHHLH
jgi:hypothetical protein